MRWSLHGLYVLDVTQVFEPYGNTNKELSELGQDIPIEQKTTLFEEQGALALLEIEDLCQEIGVPLTTEILFGGVPDLILRQSQEYNMLAIGRRGNSHNNDTQHLGSNFKQIAHHIHIPLLIGGKNSIRRKFHHVLLAYNGSEFSRKALTWTENLQGSFTEVIALAVEKENEMDHTWLADRHDDIAESALKQYEFIREAGDVGQSIVKAASSTKVDLILMGAYQHPRILGWARHSAIDTVLRGIDLPVLATK